jgi:hypothetical protein
VPSPMENYGPFLGCSIDFGFDVGTQPCHRPCKQGFLAAQKQVIGRCRLTDELLAGEFTIHRICLIPNYTSDSRQINVALNACHQHGLTSVRLASCATNDHQGGYRERNPKCVLHVGVDFILHIE